MKFPFTPRLDFSWTCAFRRRYCCGCWRGLFGVFSPLSAHCHWSVPLGPGSSAVHFRLPSFNRAVLLLLLNVRRTPFLAAKTFSCWLPAIVMEICVLMWIWGRKTGGWATTSGRMKQDREIQNKSRCTEMEMSVAAEICNYLHPARDEWLCLFLN